MVRRAIALVAVTAALALPAAGSIVPAAAACGIPSTEIPAGSVKTGDVDNGETDAYKLYVPSGKTGYVHLQMFNGDIDISVCRTSNSAVVCQSHNIALAGDGCHFPEASVLLPEPIWEPDSYLLEWGNGLPAGTYRLEVQHCFSSEDGEFCDYTDTEPVFGDPFMPGALDDAPAVQYAVAFATN